VNATVDSQGRVINDEGTPVGSVRGWVRRVQLWENAAADIRNHSPLWEYVVADFPNAGRRSDQQYPTRREAVDALVERLS